MTDKHKLQALLPADLPFNDAQKQWLGGYLAGLKSAYTAIKRNMGDSQNSLKPLYILYGSQTGNAAQLAQDCAAKAKAFGMQGIVKDMDDTDAAELPNYERILVITSTYGEGDMPDNAEMLWQAVAADTAPRLENSFFSVLAIGDSSYEHFCLAGKLWDERLAALGAERIGERVDCDIDFEEKAENWFTAVLPAISEKGSQTAVSGEPAGAAAAPKTAYSRRNPLMAKLKTKRLLSGEGSGKQIFHYEIDLIGSGERYDAGDVVNLIVQNREDLIDEILAATGADGTETVSWQGGNYPVRELLKEKLDIRQPPREFLDALCLRAPQSELKQHLDSNNDEYFYGKDIVDLLHGHPEIEFSIQDLIDLLKPLAPRAYSISSSHDKHPNEVHLTIGAVRYEQNGRAHNGIASTWLADEAEEGDIIPCYFAPNKHFSVPADGNAPMIMVGPGTGIAPFRAFLEAREIAGDTGKNWLFFGDRTREHDYIYQDELAAWQNSGLLSRLDLAFSRDQAEKIYVQDKMRENGAELFAWLEEGGYFFVCGDALRMAKDVDKALHDVIREHGGLDDAGAEAYVSQLKKDKRYVRDVY